jgi:hypothetical protein
MGDNILIKTVQVSIEDYLKDFLPSLENFCQKSPLQPRPEVVTETGSLYLHLPNDPENPLVFKINPLLPKQDQIRDIKKILEPNYPVIFERNSERLTAEEIEKLINSGVPVAEALGRRSETFEPRYKMIRVHHPSQEIDCIDLKKNQKVKFRLTLPLLTFLSILATGDKEKISHTFFMNKRFVMIIR